MKVKISVEVDKHVLEIIRKYHPEVKISPLVNKLLHEWVNEQIMNSNTTSEKEGM